MSKANNYDVVLEKVGNQPLKTTKILCQVLGLGLAAAKAMVDKAPTTIATDIDETKALELKKQLEAIGNTVSVPGLKIEAESTASVSKTKKTGSTDDAFAAIFGGSTTPKTTTVKKQSTSGTTPKATTTTKTTVAKAEPKKTTSKAPAASSDSFDSLFGGAAPKKETKTQPKASVAKTMRKEYSNGSYEGEMKDGEPHGFGTYRWNDGDVYTGEYVNGVRHGKGKFVFASGNYYDGEWANGKYHGHGIFRWSDGDEFDGEWQNGQRHGKGKWTYADGRYYTGVWENGESISSSAIVYPSDSKAQGGTVKTKFERFEYDGGDVYEGETVNGLRHGKGKYTWASGTVYEGDWVKGKRCGFGITRSYRRKRHDGTLFVEYSYEGEWKDSKKNGHGVWKFSQEYADGIIKVYQSYDGEWVNDKKHGHGKFSVFTHVEEGEYIEGNAHGMFICYEADSASEKKYISWYDHGEKLVFLVPYDSSIKTLEDAKRAKQEADSRERREYDERRAREAAQSSTSSDTSSDSDNEAVWEEFEYVEDLIEKLKNPELFDDPEDRWIANAYQYFEAFMSDVVANYSDADFATASEIFANILDLDVNGLQNYLTEKLGYIGDHYYVDYIETCLNYACLHVTKDALIPFANLCYFRTQEIGINYMGLYVKAYSRYYYANGVDVLWFERYACNGDGEYPLAKEDDPSRHEAKYGDKLDELLNNGYRMGSDCRLYLPENAESYELTAIDEEYQMEQILSNVYKIGEWNEYTEDAHKWEHGSFAMDTYYAWLENEDAHLFRLGRNGATKRTGFEKGNYSKRRVALIPMRNYIHDAMLANEQVRRNVPPSQRAQFELQLNNIIEEARMYLKSGHIVWAMDSFRDAFDYGYEPEKLAEICYDAVSDVLGENEDHWEFDDPYVEIMKIAAICDPESYAYYFSNISKLFGAYSHKYIYEVLTGEEYPG